MKATFDRSHDEADGITSFYFKPEQPLNYTPGQYAEWTLKHDHPDSRGQRRWFTISSSPTEDAISFTTKFRQEDGSSFKEGMLRLKPGDELTVSEPMGDFVLPRLIQTPLIFVAGGIGITPYRSIAKWLSDTHEERPIRLIYGVENEDEIIFQDVFDKTKLTPQFIVNNPTESWGGERGQLNADLILGLEPPLPDTLIYISGPEPMTEKLAKELEHKGIGKNRIVTDAFLGYKNI